MDLLMKWEEGDEALEFDEMVALARWLVATGLVYSAGRYGRFVRDVMAMMEDE